MADLATAYVRIIPSLKGAGKTIKNELDGVDTSSSGTKMGKSLGGGIKSGLSTAKVAIGNIVADIVLSAATAAVNSVKNVIGGAFNNYADYEQLVGGIKKLYGDSAKEMIQYADIAYRTVGMSANSYMQSVTTFSAAMLNSVGGDAQTAAALADQAMQDIADNANMFGVYTVEELTSVYQALAKGQYQTLDNLNLGFAGTKEGLQSLLNKAEELSGVHYDIGNFSDITQAIHVVQESMNITGTTANEAATTIAGSIQMTKAAYENFLTVLATPGGDIGLAVTRLVDTAANAASLIIPKITEIMNNLAVAIPQLVDQLLPILTEHSTELIDSLSEVIAALVPVLLEAAVILFAAILTALVKAMPDILQNMGKLVLNLISAIANGISPAMQEMNNFMQGILDTIGGFFMSLWNAGVQLVQEIINGAGQVGNDMAYYFGMWMQQAVQAVGDFFWSMYNAGVDIVNGLINGIAYNIGAVTDTLVGGIQNAVNSALAFLGIASPSKLFAGIGEYTMQGFAQGIDSAAVEAERSMMNAMNDVYGAADGVASVSMRAEAAGNGSMASEVASLREELRQMRLVLNIDGRAFAEATVDQIDRAMGIRSRRAVAR